VVEDGALEAANPRAHLHRRESTDPESQQRDSHAADGGSDDDDSDDERQDGESLSALEESFHDLEEEVAILVADVHDLALYTKLNITGFMKILKVRFSLAFLFISCVSNFLRNMT
jgi:hypothetical protein